MLSALLLVCAQGLELSGTVTNPDGGAVAGASVFVATARPREGVGFL